MKFHYVIYCMLGLLLVSMKTFGISQSSSTNKQNLFATHINEQGLTISSPGSYILFDSCNYTNTSTPTAITITTSHVTIDFDRKALTQSNGLDTGIGVYISDGCSDILLRGGTIANFKDYAIYIGKGCNNIMLNQMELVGGDTIMLFNGEDGSDIYDGSIINCVVSHALTCGISFNYCNNLVVEDTFVIKNQGIGCSLHESQNMKFTSCYFNDTTSLADCFGLKALNADNILFESCMFNSAQGTLKTYGLYMENCICANIINCAACKNESLYGDTVAGIYLKDCEAIMISSCQTYKNETFESASSGIYVDGCTGCQLTKCASLSNTTEASSEYACGIRLENGSKNYIDSSYFTNNNNNYNDANGIGIYIDSTEASTVIRQCQSYANSGYGIKNDSTNAIIMQSAAGNNTANFSGALAVSFYMTGSATPQTIFGADNIVFNK